MVTKYTEEQLLGYKDVPVALPENNDLSSFVEMVEEVKAALAAAHEHGAAGENHMGGNGTGRRRSSVTHRPNLNIRRHKAKEVAKVVDADGWVTTAPTKKRTSFNADAETEKETFKETFIKARPNNKNIGSSKPADPREITDKSNKAFNAFDALVSDEEDDDE